MELVQCVSYIFLLHIKYVTIKPNHIYPGPSENILYITGGLCQFFEKQREMVSQSLLSRSSNLACKTKTITKQNKAKPLQLLQCVSLMFHLKPAQRYAYQNAYIMVRQKIK